MYQKTKYSLKFLSCCVTAQPQQHKNLVPFVCKYFLYLQDQPLSPELLLFPVNCHTLGLFLFQNSPWKKLQKMTRNQYLNLHWNGRRFLDTHLPDLCVQILFGHKVEFMWSWRRSLLGDHFSGVQLAFISTTYILISLVLSVSWYNNIKF